MDMISISQSPYGRHYAISIAAERFVQKEYIQCTF